MRLRLLLHAVRAVRGRQVRARLFRPVMRRRFPSSAAPVLVPLTGALSLWGSAAFEPVTLAGEGPERLRAFHGHYGESVLGHARQGDAASARALMESWIDQYPERPGDAWHPYTLSTRTGNWLAAIALSPDALSKVIEESLWRQLLHLELNVEDDILGNHVVRNARALVLGGVAFNATRLLDRGLSLLERELPEQVLSDGGHYERSPVYHLVVLRDLLEVEATVAGSVPTDVLDRMRRFAAALLRPDGEPALFNDGSLDIAPRLQLPSPPDGLAVFPETGYAVLRRDGLWLAFDCGAPAPGYLPAHAHADALSFQLWVDGVPVVIDPGMPTYEAGAERDWFRGTRAHATVAIDDRDQFELWGAFRSGPLPRVELLEATEDRLEAAVVWRGGLRHVRRITIGEDEVTVADRIDGSGEHAIESSLPLGPGYSGAVAAGSMGVTRAVRPRAERLYERVDGEALIARGQLQLPAEFGWDLALRDVATIER